MNKELKFTITDNAITIDDYGITFNEGFDCMAQFLYDKHEDRHIDEVLSIVKERYLKLKELENE